MNRRTAKKLLAAVWRCHRGRYLWAPQNHPYLVRANRRHDAHWARLAKMPVRLGRRAFAVMGIDPALFERFKSQCDGQPIELRFPPWRSPWYGPQNLRNSLR